MLSILYAGLGGSLGALLRYALSQKIAKYRQIPIATLIANLLGSFILGLLLPLGSFWTDGFCGGLTTFSTFMLEDLGLIHEKQYAKAGGYLVVSVMLGMVFYLLGVRLRLNLFA